MVHELYKTKELDENTCLPKSNRLSNGEGQNLGNMDPTEASAQTFDKQVCIANGVNRSEYNAFYYQIDCSFSSSIRPFVHTVVSVSSPSGG